MKRASLLLVLLFSAAIARAESSDALLSRAWPTPANAGVGEIGTGVGIVFSPDLSVAGNCRFYQALGFACFDSADWLEILSGIHGYNMSHAQRPIRTLILETHGTNGNGLKVQSGKLATDDRSYISVGALQEWVEPVGVKHIIVSACNSGRLLRPEIYLELDRNNGDKLFLPATRGILDASDLFDPNRNPVTVITPGASQIETTVVGAIRELAPSTRTALETAAKARGVALPAQFAISEMLIRMLVRDPALELRTGAWVEELSKAQSTPARSERVFAKFVSYLDSLAANGSRTQTASATR